MPYNKRVNICRFCQQKFTPAKNHPQQESCGSPECKRKAEAERAARHRAKLISSQVGRKKLSDKDRADYITKKARQFDSGNEINPIKARKSSLSLQAVHEEIFQYSLCLEGLFCLLNKSFGTDIFSFGKCIEIGKTKFRDKNTGNF